MLQRVFLLGFWLAIQAMAQSTVVISEFLASNSQGLPDEDGGFPDWIEIQNTGTAPVNLLGWSLTDDPANTTKWRFPATNLNGGAFLVVFASGKDRAVAGAPLHTGFSLAADGEYLGLFAPEGQVAVSEFAPSYPPQKPNVSFGRRSGQTLFFKPPSPGVVNSGGFADWVDAPQFSQTRGFLETPFDLTLSSETPGAVLRYTTNGTWPNATNGLVYSGPIPIRGTTILRAAAFKDGLQPSVVKTHTYLFLQDVLRQSTNGAAPPGWPTSWGANTRDYGMDPDIVNSPTYRDQLIPALKSLPSFSVVTDLKHLFDPTTGIYANPGQDGRDWERPCSLELVFPDGSKGFQIDAGIRIRGGFSRSTGNPKHALRFFFRESYGASKLKFPLFGNGGTDEFDALDLRTFQNYSWSFQGDSQGVFIRDQFSRDTQLDMGRQGERGNYYHLYINGQYWGLFNSCERPEAAYAATYYGGNKEDYDVIKVEAGPYTINATDGDMAAWTRLYNAAKAGVADNAAYFKLEGRNADGTPNPAYENLLDVDNLIDYMLVILYGGNLDAPISNFLGNTSPNNWYGQRDRTGRHGGFRFSAHDSEHTLLNVAENRTGPYGTATSWSLTKSNPQYLWQQLSANAEFRLRVADHIQKHFFNDGALTPASARARFAVRTNQIYSAVVAESARWGDSKVATPLNRDQHWLPRVRDILGNYMGQRTANVLGQLRARNLYPSTVAPSFSQHGGNVPGGFRLAITAPAGEVRYTLDGTDPRQIGGAVSPGARQYSAEISLNQSTTVRARVFNAGAWSALTEAAFTVIQTFDSLRVTEIHYHPAAEGEVDGDAFEFLELKNVGSATVDLSGVRCVDGLDYTFPVGTQLEAGRFVVLVSDAEAFARRYPGVAVSGVYQGRLSNGGERLALVHATGAPLADVTYGVESPWPSAADGRGFSLVPISPNDPSSSVASAWRTSARMGGSPGTEDPVLSVPVVQLSEILAHTDLPQRDAVELFNPGSATVDVGGWFLSDDRDEPRKFRIAEGTRIPAGGYWVVDEMQFNASTLGAKAFRLDSHGDSVWLHSADTAGNLTGFSDGVAFGATPNGVSLGRFTNSVGELQWLRQSTLSLGAANGSPAVGPVILSEIDYQPAGGSVEFIELQNLTAESVPLFDPQNPTNTWRLAGVDFQFPNGVVIPAGGLLVVSAGDPIWFRQRHGIPLSVPVLGPWAGSLQDLGERIELLRPDAPDLETNQLGQVRVRVPYLTLDTVRYGPNAPWPAAAAGQGHSLERRLPAGPGDDPAQWVASPGAPLPGLTADSNRPPRADAGPDQEFPAVTQFPQSVLLEGSASDDGKPSGRLTYRWTQVGGPGPVVIETPDQQSTSVRLPGQGTYSLRLSVSDGALSSADEVVLTAARSGGQVTWIPAGATWRYLDTGVNLGTAWRAPAYDDSTWKSGRGVFGYGDPNQATTVGFGSNSSAKHITTYFRLKFNGPDPASVIGLLGKVLRDDGVVVWLNGIQVAKDNLPEGDVTYATLANSAIGGTDETTYFEYRLDPGALKPGDNTLAVEVHQNSASSSDLSFDLSLQATVLPANQAPTVDLGFDRQLPAPGILLMDAVFRDDGLPMPPGVPWFEWSGISGPAPVTFADAQASRTAVTFDQPGDYVIGFQIKDGILSARDEVRVRVGGAPAGPVMAVETTATGLVLKFNVEAGRPHTVQVCEDLLGGAWNTFEAIPAISRPATLRVAVPVSGNARFFRVLAR